MRDLDGLRVCFIAGTLGQGGAERQLYYMLSALRAGGAAPRVLCLTEGEFWEERVRALGVPVRYVGAHRSRLRRLARVVAELRREPADVVQSQHFYTNLYACGAARVLGTPEIGALRSNVVGEVAGTPGWLGGASLRVPRLLAANSRHAIDAAAALGVPRGRLRLLPNVIDAARFTAAPRGGRARVRLLFVGRLSAEKRCDRFLRALAAVRRALGAAVQGVVVGDGPERDALARCAAELGLLPDGVEFLGLQADVAPAYHDADVLVLTSDREGTPNVVLEAMACGLPVVATRVGDVPDLVRHGETGFVVDREDEAALADALVALAGDGDRRATWGARARQEVERRHALPRLAADLGALYDAALDGAAPRTPTVHPRDARPHGVRPAGWTP